MFEGLDRKVGAGVCCSLFVVAGALERLNGLSENGVGKRLDGGVGSGFRVETCNWGVEEGGTGCAMC